MKPHLHRLLLILLLFTGAKASAQKIFTLSGRVLDSVGAPQKAATVFISGTTLITLTDGNGDFKFTQMPTGTFQLSVNMLGFDPYAHNVVIQNGPVEVKVVLKVKSIVLREVVIGPDHRQEYMNLFKKAFLGTTNNANQCVLLNPDAVNFIKKNGILTADANEFLRVENKRLGYKIKYLLKDFSYDANLDIVLYDGETSFEELPGTDKMKKTWAQNRLETYHGSMMHFLRSVYNHTTKAQGFMAYNLVRELKPLVFRRERIRRYQIDTIAISFDDLVTPASGTLKALKFKMLYINYADYKKPKLKTEKIYAINTLNEAIVESVDKTSVLKLTIDQAVIDGRGSYSDYKSFYVFGLMAEKRVGDQLPFEYQPPVK